MLDIILANPDPVRFGPAVIGNPLAAAMTDAVGTIALPVSPEDFGRKARADLLRARISRIDPDHPDGFCALRSLNGILDELAVETGGSGRGTEIRGSAGQVMNEPVIRRAIQSNERPAREVFGRLTSTPVMRLAAAAVSADDYENLTLSLVFRKISGAWIDTVGAQIAEITKKMMSGYRCETQAFSTEGRDILVVRDDIGSSRDLAYVFSGRRPTVCRWASSTARCCSTYLRRKSVSIVSRGD